MSQLGPPPRALVGATIVMMLAALAALPYGYYQLLRLVAFVTAAWVAIGLFQHGARVAPVVFGLLALTFNPVFPIHLDRGSWSVLNVIAAVIFAAFLANDYRLNAKHDRA